MRAISFLAFFLTVVVLNAEPAKLELTNAFGDALAEGSVKVLYSSIGCFHSEDYELVFQLINDDAAKVSVTELVREKVPPNGEPKVVPCSLGVVMLTSRDLERFAKLLTYYENPRPSVCTTRDHIVFQKIEGEKVTVLADVVDGTCGTDDRLELLTFFEIIRRARMVLTEKANP
jgi:hypothetical protein